MFSHSFTNPGKRTSSFLMNSQKAVLCKGFPLPFVCSPHSQASRTAGMYSHFSEPLRMLQVAQRTGTPDNHKAEHICTCTEVGSLLFAHKHAWTHRDLQGLFGETCQAGETRIYSFVFPQSLFSNCLQDKRHQTMPQPVSGVYTQWSATGGGTSRVMSWETSCRALVAAVPPQLAAEGRLRPRATTRLWPQLSSGRGEFTSPGLIGTSALLVGGVIFIFCSEKSIK